MIQKIMIEVESEKPLTEYGDRHVILYDNVRNRYYVQTREKFLEAQNQSIEQLEKRMKDCEEKINNYIEDIKKEKNDFIKESEEKYNEFLKSYALANEKILNMVKSVVVEG